MAAPVESPVPRRILFLSNDIAYLYNFRGPLMRAFREKGYEVLAIAPAANPDMERNIKALGATFEPWLVAKTGTNPVSELRALADLALRIRKFKPDIFFGYTIKPVLYGAILASLLGVPRRVVMITGLGYAFLPGGGWKKWLVSRIVFLGYRLALRRSNLAIFQNQDDIDLFRAQGLLTTETETAKVNGSGVDIGRFAATELPQGPVQFLLVGRLLRDKGVYEFVEAARIVRQVVPDAQFVLVGKRDTNPAAVPQKDLDSWIAEGIVEHRGHLNDPVPAFRDAHVFVLPSYREGTPRTCLEAMASARPIITTDAPGCRETVADGDNGFLVPMRDGPALAAAMLRLANDRELAMAMGRRGREIAEDRFALFKVVAHTVRLIEGPGSALISK
jgi:glycosyltransferase involved in cell wall biosynthesis